MIEDVHTSDVERWTAMLGGAALAAYGIKQRSLVGAMLAASSGTLMFRGATGRWPVARATGTRSETQAALSGSRGVNVGLSITIGRRHDELYFFWWNLENLPSFMEHLVSVRSLDPTRSHWVAKAPGGRTVEWDAEIINDLPNELIAWQTVGDADVISAGSVRFVPTSKGDETMVHVRMQYEPPAGKVGAVIAWMLGEDPAQSIREDLRRFKALMEAGEIPTTAGQPRGQQSILNYDWEGTSS